MPDSSSPSARQKNIIKKSAFRFGREALLLFAIFGATSLAMDYWRGIDIDKGELPPLSYQSIDGEEYNINTLSHGELTIMYFWATWCGPCKVTSPSINKLQSHYPVVSIALESGHDDELQRYMRKTGYNFPVVNDENRNISKRWHTSVTPTIVFIHNNKVIGVTSGASSYPGLIIRAWWLSLF